MKKYFVVFDILCYGVIPYLIWNVGRDSLGDYYAILLSTAPGIIYTVIRFSIDRQFNLTGIFILGSLFISTTVNVISSSAESMLWNQVYVSLFFAAIYLFSILIRKPLALYFMVDIAYLQGYPRKDSKPLYYEKGLFIWFQLVTCIFVFRGLSLSALKAWLLTKYGVNGYGQMIIYMNSAGWVFSILTFAGFMLIGVKITKHLKEHYDIDIKPPNQKSIL